MENKMTIIAKDGTALIGNHFHELNDKSKLLFTTNDIHSFLAYLDKINSKEISIYFFEETIMAMPNQIDHNSEPIATCGLNETGYIEYLRRLNGKKISIEDTEKTMRLFRPFAGSIGLAILDFCKHSNIEDTVRIEHEKNNTGEYLFSVMRKRSGKENWNCPQSISFKVPIFKNIADERSIIFETYFDYEEIDGKVKMIFTFENIDFENVLEFNKKEIIETILKDIKYPKFWGAASFAKATDQWRFKSNPLKE